MLYLKLFDWSLPHPWFTFVELHPNAMPKYIIFCLLICALNYGPNVATYVLPTVAFPVNVRGMEKYKYIFLRA